MDEPVSPSDPRLRSLETEGIDAGEEQGRSWVRRREPAPAKVGVRFGEDGMAAFILVAAGALSNRDASKLGAEVPASSEGKGGGRGRDHRGRGPGAGRIADAMKVAASR
jgi:hypothetical protein